MTGSFAAPTTTISSQLHTLKTEVQQLQSTNTDDNPKMYKMPTFQLEKFDDYTQQDPVLWWEAFTTQLRILPVAKHAYIGALFLNSKGGCQTWLIHLATSHGVDVPDLKDNITWEELTRLWKKRFIVDDAPALAINASTSSMGQVWLGRGGVQGPRPLRQMLLVQQHQAQDLPVPRSGQGGCATPPQLGKLSSAEGEATPPSTPPDSAALLAASCTSGEDANVASPRYTYEDYAVHLVPPLDQPLHVRQSTACTVSSPSATDLAASPQSIAGDSTSWSRLEELDPLTFADFQWMPVPSTGRLSKPHCNVLMAQLRDYLHIAAPAPLMDAGAEVVDLHTYIAKIDCEFKTQRYDDIDAPLLYVRILIGEATCSALIDCGASRNYISQDFMVRACLGPRVRRKSQTMQVTLTDGHTHKSIDRCVDAVPVYFAPHASEAVSFDILDTKFDMILGMSWLRSEDHPVNFFHRTVHIRDRNGVLVPCTVPLPHPSMSCHVVSAASMRVSIIRDDIEEMGVCFLHALPPHDASSTDSPSDPCITELLNAYSDVFEGPHGVVPDRPIRHEIILEDGAVPPRGCIYRMSEEELSVLRAQLDDLLEKGWIRPSSSPYGAPVLFVRKKNKDLRLCINYRKLNAQTIRNADPLPRIDDLLERLGGAQFFSMLDLKLGYHQLEIRKEDRYKTAFKTRYGHFQWLVMPFGLTNAPATFQAAMTTEFRHMLDRFVLIYLDDILVYSRSLDEHVEHLGTVLERLRQAKYKANRDKCEFAQQELEYLGHYNITWIATLYGNEVRIAEQNRGSDTSAKWFIPVQCSCWNGMYRSLTSYTVMKGDSLYKIATYYQNLTTWEDLFAINPREDANHIEVGEALNVSIPCKCSANKTYVTYGRQQGDTEELIAAATNASLADVQAAMMRASNTSMVLVLPTSISATAPNETACESIGRCCLKFRTSQPSVSSMGAIWKVDQKFSRPVAVTSLGYDVANLLETVHRGWVLRSAPGKVVKFRWRVESQLGTVKDRVDGQVGGHLNDERRSFGCVPSRCHDRPGPHPFRKELARDILFEAEFRSGNPYEVAGAEWTRKTLAVGLLPHTLLRLCHLVACLDKKLLHPTNEEKMVVALGRPWNDCVQQRIDRRAMLELKGRHPDSRMNGRVVCQLDIREPLNPIFLVGTDESSKEDLCGLMCPLRLAISLGVASRTWLEG
uniref:Reverse transcriptase domain-containing protein n=1 Tax=Chara braunii TaxID=69332 RepID=A0A388MCB1_CHABU